jgi:hypothetical protein
MTKAAKDDFKNKKTHFNFKKLYFQGNFKHNLIERSMTIATKDDGDHNLLPGKGTCCSLTLRLKRRTPPTPQSL